MLPLQRASFLGLAAPGPVNIAVRLTAVSPSITITIAVEVESPVVPRDTPRHGISTSDLALSWLAPGKELLT